jgi:hypothetical protein
MSEHKKGNSGTEAARVVSLDAIRRARDLGNVVTAASNSNERLSNEPLSGEEIAAIAKIYDNVRPSALKFGEDESMLRDALMRVAWNIKWDFKEVMESLGVDDPGAEGVLDAMVEMAEDAERRMLAWFHDDDTIGNDPTLVLASLGSMVAGERLSEAAMEQLIYMPGDDGVEERTDSFAVVKAMRDDPALVRELLAPACLAPLNGTD